MFHQHVRTILQTIEVKIKESRIDYSYYQKNTDYNLWFPMVHFTNNVISILFPLFLVCVSDEIDVVKLSNNINVLIIISYAKQYHRQK